MSICTIPSQKPDKKLKYIFLLKFHPIQTSIQLLPILRDQKCQSHFLPAVVDLRLGDKLIIPPSIGQAKLTVYHVIPRTQPVTHVDALSP